MTWMMFFSLLGWIGMFALIYIEAANHKDA